MRFKPIVIITGLLGLSWSSVTLAQPTPELSNELPSTNPELVVDHQGSAPRQLQLITQSVFEKSPNPPNPPSLRGKGVGGVGHRLARLRRSVCTSAACGW